MEKIGKKKTLPTKEDSGSLIISFLGPNRAGKTTMLKSLGFFFGKTKNYDSKGPIIVSTRHKTKLFLIEGTPTAFSMINLAKISDNIFIMIDGFFGLEMEIFEIITLARLEGVKKLFFVVTHLDLFRKWKILKKIKKRIKERLSKEMNKQCRFFFLSGITLKNTYFLSEIANITRFLKIPESFNLSPDSFAIVLRIIFKKKKKR